MDQKKITGNLFSGVSWLLSGTSIQAVLQIIVLIVLARILTPEDFGIITAAQIIINLSLIFAQLGVGPALIQRKNIASRTIRTGNTISLVFGFSLFVLTFLLSGYLERFFDISGLSLVIKFLSISFIIQSVSVIYESLLYRKFRYNIIAISEVISYLVGYGLLSITFAYLGFGYMSLVYGILAKHLIKTLILFAKSEKKYGLSYSNKEAREILIFGGGMTLSKIYNYFALQADNVIIGRYLNAEILGMYSKAYQLISMPANLIGGALDKALFPIFSAIQDDLNKVVSYYYSILSLICTLLLPVSVVLFFNSENVILLILGEQWIEIAPVFGILVIALFFRTAYKISVSTLRSIGLVYKNAHFQLLYAFKVIVFSLVGVRYGVFGVSLGVLMAIISIYVILYFYTSNKLKSDSYNLFSTHIDGFVLLFIMNIFMLFQFGFDLHGYMNLTMSIILYIITVLIYIIATNYYKRNYILNIYYEKLNSAR